MRAESIPVEGKFVRQERPAPVAFQCHETLGERIRVTFADKVAAIFAQDLQQVGVRFPAEAAPDDLVHIVVAALGVSDKADGFFRKGGEDGGFVARPRVDTFARFGQREGRVPVGHGVLAGAAVGDVGIAADRITLGHRRS